MLFIPTNGYADSLNVLRIKLKGLPKIVKYLNYLTYLFVYQLERRRVFGSWISIQLLLKNNIRGMTLHYL